MKKRITAAAAALIMAASLASCGSSENKTPDLSETTTKAVTTKAETSSKDDKKETTTAKDSKDKDKNDKDSSSSDSGKKSDKKNGGKDSGSKKDKDNDSSKTKSKETTITTIAPKETMLETLALPQYSTDVTDGNALGWTKSIYEKYNKNKDDQKAFLLSLTFKEFCLVLSNYTESEAKAYYDYLHNGGSLQGNTANTTQITTPQVPENPGIKVDKTIDSELKSVFNKYNVDLNYLLRITDLSEDNFFYLWNNQKDEQFRKNTLNFLYGHNVYEATERHTVYENQLDIQLVQAYWDANGSLHAICSIISGYPGLTYNVNLKDITVYVGKNIKIAQKQVGALTQHVNVSQNGISGNVEGMGYGQEYVMDFVFDHYHVSGAFADIRNLRNTHIVYDIDYAVFDPNSVGQQLIDQSVEGEFQEGE